MIGTVARHTTPRRGLVTLAGALILAFTFTHAALAYAPIQPYGSISLFYTHTWLDGINYKAYGYSYDGYSGDTVEIIVRGHNNGGGWHGNWESSCVVFAWDAERRCKTWDIEFDQIAGDGSPGSGSTARYAVTAHWVSWDWGNDDFYTSATSAYDRANSYGYFLCWVYPNCDSANPRL